MNEEGGKKRENSVHPNSATVAFHIPKCQRIHSLTLSVCFIATKARTDLW